MDGEIFNEIKVEELTWIIDNGKYIILNIEKVEMLSFYSLRNICMMNFLVKRVLFLCIYRV